MTGDQAKALRIVLRDFRACEKERVDRCFDLAEEALSILVNDELSARSGTAVFADAAGGEVRLLTKSKLAERLGISTRTISELMTEGLPCVRFGKRVQFDYDDVLSWAKGRKIPIARRTKLRVVK